MALKGDLATRQDSQPISLLKGTLLRNPSKETAPLDGPITFALTLHIHNNEDAPPLAISQGPNTFLFVADGLGGSSAHKIITPEGEFSEAHIASHSIGEAISKYVPSNPSLLETSTASEEAQILTHEVISPVLSRLSKLHSDQKSILKGSAIRELSTTLSVVSICKHERDTQLKCIWAGDSPIIIITPDSILTTISPGDGDKPMKNVVSSKDINLESRDIDIPNGVPFIAICATDAILKLPGGELEGALSLISQAMIGTPRSEMPSKLQKIYNNLLKSGGEIDDATIAVYINGDIGKVPDISTARQITSSR